MAGLAGAVLGGDQRRGGERQSGGNATVSANSEDALFELALQKPADKRAAFLDAVCEGDPALRARLDSLLAAHVESNEEGAATPPEQSPSSLRIDLGDIAPDEAIGQTLGRYK